MARMAPPGSPAVVVAIGKARDSGKMPPPGQASPAKGKASAEEAQAVMSNEHCVDCQNWTPDTGECAKVDGTWAPEDACRVYFQAVSQDEEESREGEPPSGGADDAGGAEANAS